MKINTLPKDNIFTEVVREERATKAKKIIKRKKELSEGKDYYIHSTTSNKSFLKMKVALKMLGIENNDFFLALYNPKLKNVDPFDKTLSDDVKIMVLNECRQNIWYFLRECVRLKVPGDPKPFMLHRGNLSLIWCIIHNINIFCEMPRQNGKSIGVDSVLLWLYNIGTKNSDMLVMNKSHYDAKDNLSRIQEMRDLLPEYLRFNTKKNSSGKTVKIKDNKETMIHHITKNKLITKATATSKESADRLGRGMTQPIIWFDEFGFLKYNMVIYEAVAPSFSQAADEAKANGLPYCKIITTTPGDMMTDAGKDANIFRLKSVPFSEEFYDWKLKDVNKYIDINSDNGFVNARFTYQQLGRDNAYFSKMRKELGGNALKIRREILLEWLTLNEQSPFDSIDLEEIERISKNMTPVKVFRLEKYYDLVLYKNIEANKKYIISCDVSTGSSRDYSTMVITDTVTKEPIGVFKNNKVDTVLFSKLIYIVASKIATNSLVVIERNNVGSAVLQNLLRTDIAQKIYYSNNLDTLKINSSKSSIKYKGSNSGTIKYGLWTDSEKREQMYETLILYVQKYKDRVAVPELYEEIKSLIYDPKHKRIDHTDEGHDDLVMGYLIGLWVYYYDSNLSKFGIIRYPDIDPNTGLTQEEIYEIEQNKLNKQQESLRQQMERLSMSEEEYMLKQELVSDAGTISDLYREIEKRDAEIVSNPHSNIMNKLISGSQNSNYIENNPNVVNLTGNNINNINNTSFNNDGFNIVDYIGGGDSFD